MVTANPAELSACVTTLDEADSIECRLEAMSVCDEIACAGNGARERGDVRGVIA
jgi:hypothetical protein